jgi:hypothetical protein
MYTVLGCKITNPDMAKAIAQQMADAHGSPEVERQAETRRPTEPTMNKTERLYGERLDRMKTAGTVKWWAFNKVRLRIADGEKAAWYKPDFFVEFADGHFEMHETKGFERARGMLALKVAAGQFPMFRFVLVKRVKGEWVCEEFGGAK